MDMLQLRKTFPRNYDFVSPDYDVSPSCRFSHGTAHIFLNVCTFDYTAVAISGKVDRS